MLLVPLNSISSTTIVKFYQKAEKSSRNVFQSALHTGIFVLLFDLSLLISIRPMLWKTENFIQNPTLVLEIHGILMITMNYSPSIAFSHTLWKTKRFLKILI